MIRYLYERCSSRKVGGFGLPFYVVGTITLLVAPLNVFLLPSTKGKSYSQPILTKYFNLKIFFSYLECAMNVKSGSFRSILKIPSVIVTCFIIALVSTTWAFLDPTLEPHLRHVSDLFLSLCAKN